MNVDRLEKASQVREQEWLLQQEIPIAVRQLHLCLVRCVHLFKLSSKPASPIHEGFLPENSIPSNSASSHHPSRYVFSSNSMDSLKAFVTLDGSHITAAELKLKLPSSRPNAPPLTCFLKDGDQWPLSQLQIAGQCVQRAVSHLSDAAHLLRTSPHSSSATASTLLQRLEVMLSKSVDSLMIPDHLSLTELSRLGYQFHIKPTLPDDTMVAFYIHCSRLVLAVYTVTPAASATKQASTASVRAYVGSAFERAGHRWEVTNVSAAEVSVPWVSEVLCLLTTAQQLCQQLKEKMALLSPAFTVS